MTDMEQGEEAAEPAPQSRTDALKDQIDEVTDVMKVNIKKILEQEDKMDKLSTKAQELKTEAENFQHISQNVRSTYWWKNIKLIVVIVIVLIIILLIILLATGVIPTKAIETKP